MKKSTKSEVLRILQESNGEPVSGEALASELDVSRNSVWKAVNSLKEQGYKINGKQKRGYVLSDSNVLSASEIKRFLTDKSLGGKIEVYDVIDSTNNAAKNYAMKSGGREVFDRVFVANCQTAGRGRLGRSFYSPPKTGLYMSFLLHPQILAESAVMLTTAASVAVCRAIENTANVRPEIKWVNDIYISNKKVCGILTEAVTDFESGAVESVVIGIGINISTEDFPDDLGGVAGNIGCAAALETNIRSRLAAEVINQVQSIICEDILSRGDRGYIKDYKERSMVLGKDIIILNTNETARAVDIDDEGGLVAVTAEGKEKVLSTGEISIRLR